MYKGFSHSALVIIRQPIRLLYNFFIAFISSLEQNVPVMKRFFLISRTDSCLHMYFYQTYSSPCILILTPSACHLCSSSVFCRLYIAFGFRVVLLPPKSTVHFLTFLRHTIPATRISPHTCPLRLCLRYLSRHSLALYLYRLHICVSLILYNRPPLRTCRYTCCPSYTFNCACLALVYSRCNTTTR